MTGLEKKNLRNPQRSHQSIRKAGKLNANRLVPSANVSAEAEKAYTNERSLFDRVYYCTPASWVFGTDILAVNFLEVLGV
jgi:hypothetical protein